jgi:acetyl-CoA synthetase
MYANFSGGEGSAFLTAGDWTSPLALLGVINPALWYGCSIVAQDSTHFGGDEFFASMERFEATDAFIPSSQMIRLRQTEDPLRIKRDLKLRSILTTPDAFTQEMHDWAADSLGATLNVTYGARETGIIATTCEKWFDGNPGTAGRAAPGHSIEIVDERGNAKPVGHKGRVAISRFDPALFLGYLDDSEKTLGRFAGDWFMTGDSGYKNEGGDLYLSPPST